MDISRAQSDQKQYNAAILSILPIRRESERLVGNGMDALTRQDRIGPAGIDQAQPGLTWPGPA